MVRHSSDSQMVIGATSGTQAGCTLAAYYHRQRSRQLEKVIATNTGKKYSVDGELAAQCCRLLRYAICLLLNNCLGALGGSPWAKGFPRLNKIPISLIQESRITTVVLQFLAK